MIVNVILVFDTEDSDVDLEGDLITLEEIKEWAEEMNLDTARQYVGYQGWRVEVENEAKE